MKHLKVALIGNPNVGKTSVFNALTGLNQHVGNYPGITVERKAGTSILSKEVKANIVDLPGVYSINPSSKDEEIALSALFDVENKDYPDVVVVIAEVENLKRNLLLFTQIKDLGFPTILALNMADQMEKKGISVDVKGLEEALQTKIVLLSARKKEGIENLKEAILSYENLNKNSIFNLKTVDNDYFELLSNLSPNESLYKIWLSQTKVYPFIKSTIVSSDASFQKSENDVKKLQHRETIKRYQFINAVLKDNYTIDTSKATDIRMRFDRILTHKVWGYVIFLFVLLLIYGSIFELASYPMEFVDGLFSDLSTWISENLPAGKLTELIANGIVPGLGGVMMFVPQIAILFFLISILEETGYMSRVVFLMDRLMRPFGLSGKSVVPLVSGTACAIPAIMAARNIENPKERLITMLVTPFTTCSARIPVYIIIISLIIPKTYVLGFIPLQALVMTFMYILGFLGALGAGWILSKYIKMDRKAYFIIEMPTYKKPILKNVFLNMYEKVVSYIVGAGKIILALSVVIWFLGSHGPSSTFGKAEEIITEKHKNDGLTKEELANEISGYQLESSYIGMIGTTIEPVFRPLGYDWKMSIAVLTSFAAREVFVGNLATLYNLGEDVAEDDQRIVERMASEKREDGSVMFDFATGVSLLLFYAFAMQCLSTVGVTKKETNSWKWTAFQMIFMTGFAYIAALIAYQTLK
ncbi:ferrous iron transport protein B [Flavobacterium sp. xlx-214]|uniref:ferrous iron transport protein B n=1 Tax=unclassified Flavobacterium TaxID=196869 RepID=UPI0013D5A7DF|nr:MULTISPECIES: ferrous iron transport protein B [unclassified Flavobacterium]MBA5793658.1 ferrous iron transport protein B [Flavobacterium sp. xlx-221]QMI84585.1 ferrous iron transport protein B [Flavobacterium sp. xlx-214]